MMMKWKLANKLHKKRLSSSDILSDDEGKVSMTRKYSSPISTMMQPKRVSLCSNSEKEDCSSIVSASTHSIEWPVPTMKKTVSPFELLNKPSKVLPTSDICFAPIVESRRRLDFESPTTVLLDGKNHLLSTPQAALVSPRLTPDFTTGASFEETQRQEINKGKAGTAFPSALYIPTTDEQNAASILISLKEDETGGIEEESLNGGLLFSLPKRRRISAEHTKRVFENIEALVDTSDESDEEKLHTKKRRKSLRTNKYVSDPTKATRGSIAPQAKKKIPAVPELTGVRLAMPDDAQELNSLHCFVRSDLLEVFAMDEHAKQKGEAPRVGFRCVHCGHLSRKEKEGASMSIFFPKSLQDIYRSVCTWQRIHFKACKHVPENLKERYDYLKDMDRTRGKKQHWVNSAARLGLRNLDDHRGGIVWDPEA